MEEFPADIQAAWALGDVVAVADTPRSRIFRCRLADQRSVIAKLLKPAGQDEQTGFDYLEWRNGHGAVRLLARTESACLLEDAGTLSLADHLSLHGDEAAALIAAETVRTLHEASASPYPATLKPLKALFATLFERASSHQAGKERDLLRLAAAIAERLLGTPSHEHPLHGDIHHDNILSHDDIHWKAIDPKGYWGSPVYDLANLFGNPLGATDLILDPCRIARLADLFAPILSVTTAHVIEWAIAHAGLSACWSLAHPNQPDEADNVRERLAFVQVASALLPSR